MLVFEDTDFGALLARSGSSLPSFVLIRAAEPLTSSERAAFLIADLPDIEADLDARRSSCSHEVASASATADRASGVIDRSAGW